MAALLSDTAALLVAGGNGFGMGATAHTGIAALLISSVLTFADMSTDFHRRAPDTRALIGRFVGMYGVAVVVAPVYPFGSGAALYVALLAAMMCWTADLVHAARCWPRRSESWHLRADGCGAAVVDGAGAR
jgi:hypothetical protein